MSNIRLSLNQRTAKLVANGATAIFVPWKEQPSYTWGINAEGWSSKEIKPPCQQGDTLYLLETWGDAMDYNGNIGIIYKSEWEEKRDYCMQIKWHSPITMPNKDCRHVWAVGKIEAVRFDKLRDWRYYSREIEYYKHIYEKFGFKAINDFQTWFKTTYPHLNINAWGWYIEKENE